MQQQIFNNPQLSPSPELLQKGLGDNYANFDAVMTLLVERGVVSEWNYYKDGKSWLCKAQYKKKTVLWLSVWDDCFKLSFFFTEKTKASIDALPINIVIKDEFNKQKATGKLILLLLEIRSESMLNDIEKILEYKISCR